MLRKLFTQQLILHAYHHLKSGCILLRLKTYLQTIQLRLMATDERARAYVCFFPLHTSPSQNHIFVPPPIHYFEVQGNSLR